MSNSTKLVTEALTEKLSIIKNADTVMNELSSAFGYAIENVQVQHKELTVYVKREQIVQICEFLKTNQKLKFNFLSDLCGVDRGEEIEPRFEVVYHLYSIANSARIRLKVQIPEEDCCIETVSNIWSTANWHERETYDLLGINFTNHPDLRKILTPNDLEGYPLRKDFPLRGY